MAETSAYRDRILDMLVDCSMFNQFSSNELQRVAAYFNLSEIPEAGTLFNEGDEGTFMGIIHSGRVSVFKADSDDRPVQVATLKKDKTFGEMAVLDGERRSATCVAATPCSLLTLSRESLERMMDECPRIAARVIRAIAITLSRRLRVVDFKVAEHQL